VLVLSATVLVLVIESRLVRIVAKLTRMAMKFDGVSESSSDYNSAVDYEHEHRPPRRTEHEHDEEPEQNHFARNQNRGTEAKEENSLAILVNSTFFGQPIRFFAVYRSMEPLRIEASSEGKKRLPAMDLR